MNGFAQLISSRRAELGLDSETVAAAIERSEAVLTAWEGERTFPEDPSIVDPLAKVLRLPKALLAEAYAQSAPQSSGVTALIAPGDGDEDDPGVEAPVDAEPPVDGSVGEAVEVEAEYHEADPALDTSAPAAAVSDGTAELPIESLPEPVASGAVSQAPPHRAPYEPPRAIRADPIIPPQPAPERVERDLIEQLLAMAAAPFEALAGRFKRNRWTSRAPVSQLSYVEDRKQRTTYQLRAIFTGVAVLVMILLIRWAWSQFAEAFGSLWETLVDAI